MALLGSYIDVRTIAAVNAAATATFAHGLPASPDFVCPVAAATEGSATNHWKFVELHDATNVTISNAGNANSPVLRIMSLVAHSLIR